jgi:hypothetical protein
LIQLAGLIGLFVAARPYNWLGWVLIIAGGVLYRLELKRRKSLTNAARTAEAE